MRDEWSMRCLLIGLCSYPHLRLQNLGSDQKYKIADTKVEMSILCRVAGLSVKEEVRSSVLQERLKRANALLNPE